MFSLASSLLLFSSAPSSTAGAMAGRQARAAAAAVGDGPGGRSAPVAAPLPPAGERTRLQSLHGSLLQDLMRFRPDEGRGLELLEVLAASLRHGRPLSVQLQHGVEVWPLSVYPYERCVHTPLGLPALLALPLSELRVLQVQLQTLPREADGGIEGSLPLLLWELALRGSRAALLPEIAGPAAYRVAPGSRFDGLPLAGTMALAVERLRGEAQALRSVARWEGFDEDRAVRLLNALYLQAALIVSRSTPAATTSSPD